MNKLTSLFAAAIILCSAAVAQTLNERVTVHFSTPVIVGETKLPAGICDIQVVRGSSNNTILVFRAENGVTTAAVANRVAPADTEATSSVGLSRHGNDLHLFRVTLSDQVAYELNPVE
ncbi:MAG: hypothetical protein ABI806_17600 [Candidatus Solibacter sp.]